MAETDRLDETLRALHRVLERVAVANEPPEVDPRGRFFEMFNREADEYEEDLCNKHRENLNATLIFASLFSAVVGAFIIDIQRELRPDYNEMSFAVLKMLLNATSGIPKKSNVPVPSGPSASAIQVQSILFASLASALLAAFLAMLGKRWLNLRVEGSLVERGHQREPRIREMTTWRFRIIMECIPLVVQVSVLLLGYALAQYMWGLSQTVSAVIAGFTGFGVLFYLFTVFASIVWETCPFQTPVSVALRYVISLVKRHQRRLSEVVRQSTAAVTLARPMDEEPASPPQTPVETLSIPEEADGTRVSDADCISTILQFASTLDAVVAIARFILEINWPSNVRNVPLLGMYDCLGGSFEFMKDGKVLVRPGMRTQAYESARALLHLRVRRLCADATDDTHSIVASKVGSLLGFSQKDDELRSTIEVIDAVFNGEREIQWQDFVFSDAHYCWLSHVLRCRAWDTFKRTERMPTKEVLGFLRYSFSKEPLPPSRVIADCLLIVDMMVGSLPELEDSLFIKDQSDKIEGTLQQIYRNIELAVSPRSSDDGRQRATQALELLVPLKQENLSLGSYKLFLTIMSDVATNPWLWYPAELSLIGAFKWGIPRPHVTDPAPLVVFLAHCFSEQERGVLVDVPVERTMLALACAPAEVIGDGISRVDFTQPLFFNGICRALQNGAPHLLRSATFTFLRHLDDQLFNKNKTFTEDQVNEFISGWFSSARVLSENEHDSLLEESLGGMYIGFLDSSFWRDHIPQDRWGFTVSLTDTAQDRAPPSFYRCAQNSTIIPFLKQDNIRRKILPGWARILWAKYHDLSEEVKSQLEKETKEIMDRTSRQILPTYQEVVEERIRRIQERINSYASGSSGDDIAMLKGRLESLHQARGVLKGIQRLLV